MHKKITIYTLRGHCGNFLSRLFEEQKDVQGVEEGGPGGENIRDFGSVS